MTSALLAAAVPIEVLSSSLLPAGVRAPNASALLGVHDGGGIEAFEVDEVPLTLRGVLMIPERPSSPAFARKLFDALAESFCDSCSLADGAAILNGVLASSIEELSAGSSD